METAAPVPLSKRPKGKRYRVTPHLIHGRTSYAATFRNAMGERVHRGLSTDDENEANLTCAGLVRLWTAGVTKMADVPGEVPLPAIRLYFGEAGNDPNAVNTTDEQAAALLMQAEREAEAFPQETRGAIISVLVERKRLQRENEGLRLQLAMVTRTYDDLKTRYANLQASAIGRATRAAGSAKLLYEVMADYFAHISTKTSRRNSRDLMTMAAAFVTALPEAARTIADVSAAQIAAFMDSRCADAAPNRRQRRRRKVREALGRFVNFACKECELPSIMDAVEAVPKQSVLRERGDIQWHDLSEVKAAIKALPSDYWKALIGALGYAGLQLAELCWITTVEDPDDAGAVHAIKAENRRRHVGVHRKLLLPLLRKHLEALPKNSVYLFPMPADKQRRKRATIGGSLDRWQPQTLSTVMRGHGGGKKRKPTAGLLPAAMNAKSLRRTFGSLMLRSGKSYAEVAASMGNTETMVRQHYARLKGCEVDCDF